MQTKVKRTRRRHSDEFRAEVDATSRQPGVSVSAVALANGLNTNLLRRWIKEDQERPTGTELTGPDATPGHAKTMALVPVTVDPPAPSEIRIDIRRGPTTVQMAWPVAHAAMLGEVVKDLLR